MAATPTSDCPLPVFTENPIILDITPFYGAIQVGSFLSAAVWGISSLQVFLYFMHSAERDSGMLKALVGALWCVDTTNQILTLKGGWKVLIQEYGRIAGLSENQSELLHHTWLEAIVIFAVQMYFVHRIFKFGSKIIREPVQKASLVAFCGAMVLAVIWQPVGIIVYLAGAFNKPLAEQAKPFFINMNMSMRAAAVGVDVAIAICMMFLLSREGQNGLTRTKRMVHRLTMIVVTSGTLTAVVVTIVLILIKIYPTTLYYCTLEFVVCSLYFSSFLANLNSRDYAHGHDGVHVSSYHNSGNSSTAVGLKTLNNSRYNHRLPKDTSTYSQGGVTSIEVHHDKITHGDVDYAFSPVKAV
ncbi:hypothetical protein AAF712_008311 [Marasmius tenuissimus]|uniref:DUF6534 domain-containing protein n=1 Tax=Marasmius tenuissimus TaxID=585030 RepID=A0ABR2ZVE6_9AGAR